LDRSSLDFSTKIIYPFIFTAITVGGFVVYSRARHQILTLSVAYPPGGPTDAEIPSHKLLLKAGFIRQVAAGVFDFTPIAFRVMNRIMEIIRQEMDRIGGQELLMPVLNPPPSGSRRAGITPSAPS